MKKRIAILVALLVAAALLTVAALERGGEVDRQSPDNSGPSPLGKFVAARSPHPAPAVGFTDLTGKAATLHDFAGKLVLVNLWATWCAPCRREMPSLERLQHRLGDKAAILAISEDMGGAKTVAPFLAKLGLNRIAPYLDPKMAVGQALKVEGLPTSVLIDRDGNIRGRVEGEAEWDSPKMLAAIAPFLPKTAAVTPASPRAPP